MPKPRALIIRTAGINCDLELAHAFELAGAETESIHLNQLIEESSLFDRFDLIGFPGGFSYGDDIAAGRVFAMLVRQRLYPALQRCIDRGVPMIAPCNGFQVLVQIGLLPGPINAENPSETPPKPSVTLAPNLAGRFIDNWVDVEIETDSPCIWTRDLTGLDETQLLPIAHGEGRFVTTDETLQAIENAGLVAVRYAEDSNPNGSMNHIAGVCDRTGLILGLMPHPERYTTWTNHPHWTRLDDEVMQGVPFGLQMFENAVRFVRDRLSVSRTSENL